MTEISLSHVIFLTLKIKLKRGMKLRLVIIITINRVSNEDKCSIQFQNLGKMYLLKESQSDNSNLVFFDY